MELGLSKMTVGNGFLTALPRHTEQPSIFQGPQHLRMHIPETEEKQELKFWGWMLTVPPILPVSFNQVGKGHKEPDRDQKRAGAPLQMGLDQQKGGTPISQPQKRS